MAQETKRTVDITKRADCGRLVDDAVARYGRVDAALINAASNLLGPALDLSEEDWTRNLEIELTGYFYCAQAVGAQMVTQGEGGSIIMLSANSSVVGYSDLVTTAAAKGGVDQLVGHGSSAGSGWDDGWRIRKVTRAPGAPA